MISGPCRIRGDAEGAVGRNHVGNEEHERKREVFRIKKQQCQPEEGLNEGYGRKTSNIEQDTFVKRFEEQKPQRTCTRLGGGGWVRGHVVKREREREWWTTDERKE